MDANKINDLINQFHNNEAEVEIPPWALLLFETLKELAKQIEAINGLSIKVKILEDSKAVHDRVTDELQNQNELLKNKVKELSVRVDDQEQRSRNLCLLFHGVEEYDNENTDDIIIKTVKDELGLEMAVSDIQRSHRLGPKRHQRQIRAARASPRAIIIRFTDYRKRRAVFQTKKKLKGKPISISENLTKCRYELLKAATAKYGRGKVWSSDGLVTTKIGNEYVVFRCLADLE